MCCFIKTGYECLWNFGDNQTATTSYADQGKAITHIYKTVGNNNVKVMCNNTLSQQENSTLAIVQQVISPPKVKVTCNSRFDDCFQHDEIVVTVTALSGTEPITECDMGNGVTLSRYFLLSSNVTYRYANNSFGRMIINVTIYNRVSSQTVTTILEVKELREIKGLELNCPAVIFGTVTSCLANIFQGTGNCFFSKMFAQPCYLKTISAAKILISPSVSSAMSFEIC